MSTKAIREALSRLEMLMEEPPAGMSVEDAVLLNSARTEVEAIERAANAITDDSDVAFSPRGREDFSRSIGLLEIIVRQQKEH